MTIKTLEIVGIGAALTALRLPYGKKPRSIIGFNSESNDKNYIVSYSSATISDEDMTLLKTLIKRGDEHAKVIRGIIAYAEIKAPVYFFCEEETYRAGHERLSSESTMHGVAKGLAGDELVKVKSELPMGTELTKVDMFSYQCLRNIVKQRHNHRLPEWHMFVEWIKTLPFAKELIFSGIEELYE